jgi:hypothetical protein
MRARPVVEPLEPKLLYSADLPPLVMAAEASTVAVQDPVQQASTATREIIFIDASVPELTTLQRDLAAQAEAGRDVEVIVIRADEDGLARITDTLTGRQDVGAVHLISHGDDGKVQLGQTVLDTPTLLQRASEIALWGSAFAPDGDLLIYGCDVAASANGQALVQDLAALTGADVAASSDSTGQQALGGDWALEVATGGIEHGSALSAQAQAEWGHTLALVLLPPSITSNGGGSTATTSVNENTTYVTTVTATALDSSTETLTYSINGGADAGRFRIDASTGQLHFRNAPNYESPIDANGDNAYQVTVAVSNSLYTTTQALTVNVQDLNEAPVITSDGGEGYTILQVTTGSTAITQVQAADPEGDPITYFLSSSLDGSLMTIDPTTGALSFRNPVDISNDQSSAGNNVYRVFAHARDPGGSYDVQLVLIQIVDPTPVNQSPVIDSHGGGEEASLSVAEGQTAVTTVHATDADSSTLTYSLIGGADQGLFAIDATTGVVTFRDAPDATAPADADQDNVYELIVSASDGNTSDSQVLSIQVLARNRAPVNSLPAQYTAQEDSPLALTGLSVRDIDAGSGVITVSLQAQHGTLTVRDDVGGGLQASQIQYSHGGRQVLLTGTVSEINATLASTGAVLYEANGNYHGTDTLTMVSNDQGHSGLDISGTQPSGALTDTDQATITIDSVDDAPVITGNTLTISQGGTATPVIQLSDVDSADGVLGVRVQGVTGGHFLNTTTNSVVTQFSLGDLQAGRIVFVHDGGTTAPTYTLVAYDASGDSTASTAVVVFDASPVIVSDGGGGAATITVPEFVAQVTTVQAQDVDSTTLTYAIVGGADQALFSIDATTGALRFNTAPDITTAPYDTHALTYTVVVAATDGSTQARQTLTIRLDTFNRAPVNTLPGSIAAQEDTPLALTGLAVTDLDAGNGTITVTLHTQHGTLSVRHDVTGGVQGNQIQYDSDQRQVTLSGTVAQINATLSAYEGVLYLADADYHGADILTMLSNDRGHSGLGSGGTSPSAPLTDSDQAAINVAAINDAPVITANSLAIDQGGRAVPVVQVSDVDSPASALTLSVQDLRGGRFIVASTGATVTQFSLADVQAGLIVFVQDGSAQAPSYVVEVTDGQASASKAATVSFTPTPPDPLVSGPSTTPAGNDGSSNASPGEQTASGDAAGAPMAAMAATSGEASMTIAAMPDEPAVMTPDIEIQLEAPVVKVSVETIERLSLAPQASATTEAESFQYSWNASLSAPGVAEELRRNLDALHEQLQGTGIERRHVVASSIALSTGMSVGYVIWLIRGGALMGSMLSAMPAWQMIDPLPVLHRGGGRGHSIDMGEGDASVEQLFGGDAPPEPPPPPPAPPPLPPQPVETRA